MRPKPCPDCGNAPVYHRLQKGSFFIDFFLWPLLSPLRGIWHLIEPIIRLPLENKILPKVYRSLYAVGLGKIITEPDEITFDRARVFWLEAEKRGVKMWEFRPLGKSLEFFVAEYKGKTIGFESLPRPGKTEPKSLFWIDNKNVLRKKFQREGIPMARGGSAWSWRSAENIFNKVNGSVIIKPHHGSRSRHTTTHISDLKTLKKAFNKAKVLSPLVIVEEELKGMVHRITLVDGKIFGIIRREPPFVTGDGVHKIKELVEIENKNPLRHGHIFHTLVIDQAAKDELERQHLNLESVPEKDVLIFLGQKASRGIGGGATDMTEVAHPDNVALFEKVARILEDPLVGLDFIITDIKKSWKEVPGAGLIECNSMPFIDIHHYPLIGTPRNIAGALWDIVLPETNSGTEAVSINSSPIIV